MKVTENAKRPDELRPLFVRSIGRVLLPAGKVHSDPTRPGSPSADMVEGHEVILYDPITRRELSVAIDPRHPQSRDQLKIIQEIQRGKQGGLMPIAARVAQTCARDGQGTPVPDTEFHRIEELDTHSLKRGQNEVIVPSGDKFEKLGEWTYELDSAVDKTVRLEIAAQFSGFSRELSEADSPAWKRITADAQTTLKSRWAKQAVSPDDLEAQVDRFALTPDQLAAGHYQRGIAVPPGHISLAGCSAGIPTGGSDLETKSLESLKAYHEAMVREFGRKMAEECPIVAPDGTVRRGSVFELVENELIAEGQLPAGKPSRDPILTGLVAREHARSVANHLSAGSIKLNGGVIADKELENSLMDAGSLHQDILTALKSDPALPPESYPSQYGSTSTQRSMAYKLNAQQKVAQVSARTLKKPAAPKQEGPDLLSAAAKAASTAANSAREASDEVENISYGLR